MSRIATTFNGGLIRIVRLVWLPAVLLAGACAPPAGAGAEPSPEAEAPAAGPRVLNGAQVEAYMRAAYDPLLRDAGVTGEAVVDLVLDPEGAVVSATLVSVTHDYFRRAAENAGERLRFSPPAADEAKVRVRLYFDMRPERMDVRVVRRG